MTETVKPRRAYDATRRREQARDNRRRVLAAAHRLFAEHGYAGTSLAAVAREAGVSVQTVYGGFSTKVNLLKEVVDVGLAGDDEPIPMAEREQSRAIDTEPDAGRTLARYATQVRVVGTRVWPVLLVVYRAAGQDAAVAELARELDRQRLAGMTMLAENLMGKPGMAPGIGVDEVRDVLWTFNSPELFDLLVLRRGWPPERYEAWLARSWSRLLLA